MPQLKRGSGSNYDGGGARKIIKAAKLLEGNFQAINLARREGVKSVVGNRIRQIADQVSRREEDFNGSATEKLGELLPAMTSRKALMMRESERELPNSGLIFIPIIIAVIARRHRRSEALSVSRPQ